MEEKGVSEKRRFSRTVRTAESFNADMAIGFDLTDELKYHRSILKKCLTEHYDALDETGILKAQNLNDNREWFLKLF